jgi:uncharacterized protein
MFTVVHFEIPADDVERAQKFYRELFGWKIEEFAGQAPMDYWSITTSAEPGGMGAPGGGMMQRQTPQQQTIMYIEVPSIDAYADTVEKLGGKVGVPKTAIPGMGYYAVCSDPENNGFGIWETNPEAQ